MTAEAFDLKLYHYWRSSSSWRVRLMLTHKGIPFSEERVNLLEGAQDQATYLQQSPLGVVPSLEVTRGNETFVLIESMAIAEWLEETFPEQPLLPKDLKEKAEVRALCQIVNAGIQPLQNLRVLKEVEKGGIDKQEWGHLWINRGLTAYQNLCHPNSDFSHQSGVSFADFFLVPQLYNARRFQVSLDEFPQLLKIEKSVEALSGYQAAHPDAYHESES